MRWLVGVALLAACTSTPPPSAAPTPTPDVLATLLAPPTGPSPSPEPSPEPPAPLRSTVVLDDTHLLVATTTYDPPSYRLEVVGRDLVRRRLAVPPGAADDDLPELAYAVGSTWVLVLHGCAVHGATVFTSTDRGRTWVRGADLRGAGCHAGDHVELHRRGRQVSLLASTFVGEQTYTYRSPDGGRHFPTLTRSEYGGWRSAFLASGAVLQMNDLTPDLFLDGRSTALPGGLAADALAEVGDRVAVVAGRPARVLTTADGRTWRQTTPLGCPRCVWQVAYADARTWWARGVEGGRGQLLRTTDGGRTWRPAPLPPGPVGDRVRLLPWGTTGLVVGDQVTVDVGRTWSAL